MKLHTPYEQSLKRNCNFLVTYRFFTEEGGRKTGPPSQGYRSDFMYQEDEGKGLFYIIIPEFIDDNNNIILDKDERHWEGKANMWIVSDRMVEFHKNKMKIGTKGFFMEGLRKTAECEIIQIF